MRGAALSCLLALSCATPSKEPTKDAMERLQESIQDYNHAFQWKNYQLASSYLPNDKRTLFMSVYDDDPEALQIEELAIRKVDVQDARTAVVTVRVSYLLMPALTVDHRTTTQHWHEVDGRWILEHEDNAIRPLSADAKLPPKPDLPPPQDEGAWGGGE